MKAVRYGTCLCICDVVISVRREGNATAMLDIRNGGPGPQDMQMDLKVGEVTRTAMEDAQILHQNIENFHATI